VPDNGLSGRSTGPAASRTPRRTPGRRWGELSTFGHPTNCPRNGEISSCA
jgi:hypothetical protein